MSSQYRFAHPLVQEVLRADLFRNGDIVILLRRFLDSVAAHERPSADRSVLEVLHHLLTTSRSVEIDETAVWLYLKCLERVVHRDHSSGDVRAAATLIRQAVEAAVPLTAQLDLLRARIEIDLGNLTEGITLLERLLKSQPTALDNNQRIAARTSLAASYAEVERFAEAEAEFEVAELEALTSNDHATIAHFRAKVELVRGRPDKALQLTEFAVKQFRSAGNLDGTALALSMLAKLQAEEMTYDEFSRLVDDADAAAHVAGLNRLIAGNTALKARVARQSGRYDEAYKLYTKAGTFLADAGCRREQALTDAEFASLLRTDNKLTEALACSTRSLKNLTEIGDYRSWARVAAATAVILVDLNRIPEASELLQQSYGFANSLQDFPALSQIASTEGLIGRRERLWHEALTAYRKAEQYARAAQRNDMVSVYSLRIGEILLRTGEPEKAHENVTLSLDAHHEYGRTGTIEYWLCLALMASCEHALGRLEEARFLAIEVQNLATVLGIEKSSYDPMADSVMFSAFGDVERVLA